MTREREGTVVEWLVRLVWRLYPRPYRERFGAQLQDYLAQLHRSGRGPGPHVLVDAVVTLARSWAREVARSGSAVGCLAGEVGRTTRSVRRSPGYALVVIGILSLSLGVTTAVFSVSHAVLMGALPYNEPERVFRVQPTQQDLTADGWVPDVAFAALPQVEATALYFEGAGANLAAGGTVERVSLVQVTGDFFGVLGVDLLLGPGFSADPASPERAVLSHDLWTRAFGADRDIVGASIELNGRGYQVVGVAPADAAYPAGTDLWLPTPLVYEFYGGALGPSSIARLARESDAAVVGSILREWIAEQYADRPAEYGPPPPARLVSLESDLVGPARAPLGVLLAISGLVLLLGCLNLAGVAVSRTSARADELRVRLALGAGRSRVFAHVLGEALTLAVIGGLASLAVARVAFRLVVSWLPPETPRLDAVGLSGPVLAFAAVGAVVAGLVVGVLPAFQGAAVRGGLSRSGRGASDDRRAVRLQSALVAGQVALACVLVAGASLLGRSLSALAAIPVGYDVERVLTFKVRLPAGAYPDEGAQGAYLASVIEELQRMPGVRAAGATSRLPLSEGFGVGLRVWLPGTSEEDATNVSWVNASEGYFDAMGLAVLGPGIASAPGQDVFAEIALSRAVVQELFGDGDAVGQRVNVRVFGREEPVLATLVAVVGDFRLGSPEAAEPSRVMFTSLEPKPVPFLGFAVAATGEPAELAGRVREVLAGLDPSVPAFELRTTREAVRREVASRRALALLSGAYGVAALLLAALGLYGLVAQGVARRRRELGIRIALGARVGRLVGRAVGRALALAILGLALGIPVSIFLGGLARSLLFRVDPGDPVALAAVAVLMAGVAALAAYLPARGVGRLDPVETLRSD
jgi:predicted permease